MDFIESEKGNNRDSDFCSLFQDHVGFELPSAYAIRLAALAFDRDGQEQLNHFIKRRLVPAIASPAIRVTTSASFRCLSQRVYNALNRLSIMLGCLWVSRNGDLSRAVSGKGILLVHPAHHRVQPRVYRRLHVSVITHNAKVNQLGNR